MKVLLIGSGGREHALALKLSDSLRLSQLYVAPGNAGTAELGQNVAIKETDISSLLQFVGDESIDLTIVGPELLWFRVLLMNLRHVALRLLDRRNKALNLKALSLGPNHL